VFDLEWRELTQEFHVFPLTFLTSADGDVFTPKESARLGSSVFAARVRDDTVAIRLQQPGPPDEALDGGPSPLVFTAVTKY
jgi:hypothetical protein